MRCGVLSSPVAAEVREESLRAFFREVELGAVDLYDLLYRGHHLPKPVRPLDVERLIAGAPYQQRRHIQRPQRSADG